MVLLPNPKNQASKLLEERKDLTTPPKWWEIRKWIAHWLATRKMVSVRELIDAYPEKCPHCKTKRQILLDYPRVRCTSCNFYWNDPVADAANG